MYCCVSGTWAYCPPYTTSFGLRSSLSDPTGSGSAVFAETPSLQNVVITEDGGVPLTLSRDDSSSYILTIRYPIYSTQPTMLNMENTQTTHNAGAGVSIVGRVSSAQVGTTEAGRFVIRREGVWDANDFTKDGHMEFWTRKDNVNFLTMKAGGTDAGYLDTKGQWDSWISGNEEAFIFDAVSPTHTGPILDIRDDGDVKVSFGTSSGVEIPDWTLNVGAYNSNANLRAYGGGSRIHLGRFDSMNQSTQRWTIGASRNQLANAGQDPRITFKCTAAETGADMDVGICTNAFGMKGMARVLDIADANHTAILEIEPVDYFRGMSVHASGASWFTSLNIRGEGHTFPRDITLEAKYMNSDGAGCTSKATCPWVTVAEMLDNTSANRIRVGPLSFSPGIQHPYRFYGFRWTFTDWAAATGTIDFYFSDLTLSHTSETIFPQYVQRHDLNDRFPMLDYITWADEDNITRGFGWNPAADYFAWWSGGSQVAYMRDDGSLNIKGPFHAESNQDNAVIAEFYTSEGDLGAYFYDRAGDEGAALYIREGDGDIAVKLDGSSGSYSFINTTSGLNIGLSNENPTAEVDIRGSGGDELRLEHDASNACDLDVSAGGILDFDCTGGDITYNGTTLVGLSGLPDTIGWGSRSVSLLKEQWADGTLVPGHLINDGGMTAGDILFASPTGGSGMESFPTLEYSSPGWKTWDLTLNTSLYAMCNDSTDDCHLRMDSDSGGGRTMHVENQYGGLKFRTCGFEGPPFPSCDATDNVAEFGAKITTYDVDGEDYDVEVGNTLTVWGSAVFMNPANCRGMLGNVGGTLQCDDYAYMGNETYSVGTRDPIIELAIPNAAPAWQDRNDSEEIVQYDDFWLYWRSPYPGTLYEAWNEPVWQCDGGTKDGEGCIPAVPNQCPSGSCAKDTVGVEAHDYNQTVMEVSPRGVWSKPRGGKKEKGIVTLTFDDAAESQWEVAWPMMRLRQIPGTFFVPPGNLTNDAPYCDAFDPTDCTGSGTPNACCTGVGTGPTCATLGDGVLSAIAGANRPELYGTETQVLEGFHKGADIQSHGYHELQPFRCNDGSGSCTSDGDCGASFCLLYDEMAEEWSNTQEWFWANLGRYADTHGVVAGIWNWEAMVWSTAWFNQVRSSTVGWGTRGGLQSTQHGGMRHFGGVTFPGGATDADAEELCSYIKSAVAGDSSAWLIMGFHCISDASEAVSASNNAYPEDEFEDLLDCLTYLRDNGEIEVLDYGAALEKRKRNQPDWNLILNPGFGEHPSNDVVPHWTQTDTTGKDFIENTDHHSADNMLQFTQQAGTQNINQRINNFEVGKQYIAAIDYEQTQSTGGASWTNRLYWEIHWPDGEGQIRNKALGTEQSFTASLRTGCEGTDTPGFRDTCWLPFRALATEGHVHFVMQGNNCDPDCITSDCVGVDDPCDCCTGAGTGCWADYCQIWNLRYPRIFEVQEMGATYDNNTTEFDYPGVQTFVLKETFTSASAGNSDREIQVLHKAETSWDPRDSSGPSQFIITSVEVDLDDDTGDYRWEFHGRQSIGGTMDITYHTGGFDPASCTAQNVPNLCCTGSGTGAGCWLSGDSAVRELAHVEDNDSNDACWWFAGDCSLTNGNELHFRFVNNDADTDSVTVWIRGFVLR